MNFHKKFKNLASTNKILLREANIIESPIAFKIKIAAAKSYIQKEFGWDEDLQLKFHKNQFIPENTFFVLIKDQMVGWISIIVKTKECKLDEFYILPEYQNNRIGSHLLRNLIEIVTKKHMILHVRVMNINKSAISFYEKFGFIKTSNDLSFIHMKIDETLSSK